MAAPEFPTIEISPVGSGTAVSILDTQHLLFVSDSYGTIYVSPYIISATPNPGWLFDHFEWHIHIIDRYGPGVDDYDYTTTDNPAYSTYIEWDSSRPYPLVFKNDPPYSNPLWTAETSYYQRSVYPWFVWDNTRSCTSCKAVFKKAAPATGLILYNEYGNILCCLKSPKGLILYDDGTRDPS